MNGKNKKLYLYVTDDRYELPIFVEDSAAELAKKLGISTNTVYSSISHEKNGNVHRSRFKSVEVD